MQIFNYISAYSGIVPLLVGIYCVKFLQQDMKILLAYFVIAFLVDICNIILAIVFQNNIWLFNIFILIDYTFFVIVISLWQKKKSVKRFLHFSIPIFFLIWIITQINLGSMSQLNNICRSIEAIIFTLVASFTLTQLNNNSSGQSFFRNYRFIIVCGVLLYFAGNTFLFALARSGSPFLDSGWVVHSSINISANLIYAWGFYTTRI